MAHRGRVLRARPGINPNSSGHGVMWGLLFFLPQAVAGGVLAIFLERRLAAALAMPPGAAPRWARAAAWLAWVAAWAALVTAWVLFVNAVAQVRGFWANAGAAALLGLPAAAVLVRAWRAVEAPALRKATWEAVVGAAVLAVLLTALAVPVFRSGEPQGLAALYLYFLLPPAALALAGVAYRLGRPGERPGLIRLALIYLGVGALLVLPFPPIPVDSYNPVGLFFPLWGAWAPAFIALAGLCRRS